MGVLLDREEYIEQVYFFRHVRERLADNLATQDVLDRIHEEILSTTRLPMAIQFLATELRHSGLLASGFSRLPHYFTPFQAFVVRQAEDDRRRFSMDLALLVLEREAQYRAGKPTRPGLFVYQFETLSRNRLGYEEGLASMTEDPLYDEDWSVFLRWMSAQAGVVDFADVLYARSELYVSEQRRLHESYTPPLPALFGEKEGKIAKANHGRDPLYLFAALQRQLSYPEVPRLRPRDDLTSRMTTIQAKMREMEIRVKLLESEARGQLDLNQFLKNPDMLRGKDEDNTV
jgi:hypothetical protein